MVNPYPGWGMSSPEKFVKDSPPEPLPDVYKHAQAQASAREAEEAEAQQSRERQTEDWWERFESFDSDDDDILRDQEHDNNYPFHVFGLKRADSNEDIKNAYRKLILETHPDKSDGNEEQFLTVQAAWENYKQYHSPK